MTDRNILSDANHRTGMTVPDGYFEDFSKRMIASLPEQSWETVADSKPVVMPRTFWQRVRPYVYMAAMFAGIWLMMNLSTFFVPGGEEITSSPSAQLAQVISQSPESYLEDYAMTHVDSEDFLDDLYASGFEPASLQF